MSATPRRSSTSSEGPVVGVHQIDAVGEGRQGRTRERQRLVVAIEADDARRARLEQRTRVAAQAHGTIDEDAARFRAQLTQDLGGQDGDVNGRHTPNSDSARASSSVKGSRCMRERKRSWFQTSR